MSTAVLTGGGTAGHDTRALSLIPELRKHFTEIVFIGGNGMEKELVKQANIPFYSTDTVKLHRKKIWKNFKIPFVLAKGISEATKILKTLSPDVVFSKGGYASLPTCFAAKKLGIPIVVHESDYTMGVANKIVSRFAAKTITSFPETKGGECLGNPVRKELFCGNSQQAKEKYGLSPSKKTILITGGSLGALALNEVVYRGLEKLTSLYNIIHISGKKGNFNIKSNNYIQLPFAYDMADLYAVSDCVVARGGANTLAEIAALGKKAVIVPLPKGNSRGDQEDNARSYEKKGLVEVLPQEELFVESLLAKIALALNKKLPPLEFEDAVSKISEVLANLAKK